MTVAAKSGQKGPALEELLKAYFWLAGYFVVRGVPYRFEDEDVTDIDLWLYERPGASTRRRLIVDVKNKRSPKVSERIIWTRGLQVALGVDNAIVATTDRRLSSRQLAKNMGVILLDGEATSKLAGSDQLQSSDQIPFDALLASVKAVDQLRRSRELRDTFDGARASLVSGFGVFSLNKNLRANGFFGDQAILAQPESPQAELAIRLFYFTAALVAISLDFVLADHAFRSQEDRRQIIIEGIRFGQTENNQSISTITTAVELARQYAENGNVVAKQIERQFYDQAKKIAAEIIADYVVKVSGRSTMFDIARDLEAHSLLQGVKSFDALAIETKSFLGILLDFNSLQREKVAAAVRSKPPKANKSPDASSTNHGPLFDSANPDPSRES